MSAVLSWITVIITNLVYTYYEYISLGSQSQGKIFMKTFIYLFLSILIQVFLNMNTMKQLCGRVAIGTVILNTAIPWMLIMGVLLVLLNMPYGVGAGWKSPFSNTIGYILIYSKAKTVINDILKPLDSNVKGEMAQALQYIYKDKSSLINEITPMNFDSFWDKFTKSGLLVSSAGESAKSSLRTLVHTKDAVATFVWITLTSILVQSFVYQRIVSSGCQKTATTMSKSDSKYMRQLQDEAEQETEKQKVYVSRM